MNARTLVSVLAALALTQGAAAQQQKKKAAGSETKVQIEDVKPKEAKQGEDLDAEITNARMRAESGSKSKLSMSLGLGYSGGNVTKPLSEERPNLLGNAETETATELGGDISLRYRFNKNYSATFGIGYSAYTPLQGDVNKDERQTDISNPSLGFSRAGKLGIFQAISSIDYSHGTARAWDEIGLTDIVGIGQTMLTTVGQTALTLGVSVSTNLYLYNNAINTVDRRNLFTVGIYPFLEYAFNDTFQFRTVFGYMNFYHRRDQGAFAPFSSDNDTASFLNMQKRPSYQSMGIGIAITRDIYLYPNIQFLPTDLDAEKTNVALSATINMF